MYRIVFVLLISLILLSCSKDSKLFGEKEHPASSAETKKTTPTITQGKCSRSCGSTPIHYRPPVARPEELPSVPNSTWEGLRSDGFFMHLPALGRDKVQGKTKTQVISFFEKNTTFGGCNEKVLLNRTVYYGNSYCLFQTEGLGVIEIALTSLESDPILTYTRVRKPIPDGLRIPKPPGAVPLAKKEYGRNFKLGTLGAWRVKDNGAARKFFMTNLNNAKLEMWVLPEERENRGSCISTPYCGAPIVGELPNIGKVMVYFHDAESTGGKVNLIIHPESNYLTYSELTPNMLEQHLNRRFL